jgi:hypothetical protein
MTISPNPRVFDFSRSTPVDAILPGAGDPDLQRIFWHGTRAENVEGILENGLIPGKTICGHTCLATDPKIALLFARLEQTLQPEKPGGEPVLIRIDGAHLDPAECLLETGALKISAYGKAIKGRGQSDLQKLTHDWRAFMQATDTLGYGSAIPVGEHMLERRTESLPAVSIQNIMKEMEIGVPHQIETLHLLDEITSELTPAVAA